MRVFRLVDGAPAVLDSLNLLLNFGRLVLALFLVLALSLVVAVLLRGLDHIPLLLHPVRLLAPTTVSSASTATTGDPTQFFVALDKLIERLVVVSVIHLASNAAN